MDLPVHNRILWQACKIAAQRLDASNQIGDPRVYFPWLVRGSWMNDYSQATLFTDNIKLKPENLRRTFDILWRVYRDDLLDNMQRNVEHDVAEQSRKVALSMDADANTIGKYNPLDHLDVETPKDGSITEKDLIAFECTGFDTDDKRFLRSNVVHQSITRHVKRRLINSTFDRKPKERVTCDAVSALGRALHTLQDFFSHTNYTELLLWQLACRNELDKRIIDAFNHPEMIFEETIRPQLYIPLPKENVSITLDENLYPAMWYGKTPAKTPLVSCRFDLRDTAHSLLHMAATHLELVEKGPNQIHDKKKELALAVLGVPGHAVLDSAIDAYNDVSDFFDKVENYIRRFLADKVRTFAMRKQGVARETLKMFSKAILDYSSAESREWARAGKMRYVKYSIEEDLAKELHQQKNTVQQLPHHSLLHKDRLPANPEKALVYRLSCIFATEVTAKVIEWHFSKSPEKAVYDRLANTYLIHPSLQLERTLFNQLQLESLIYKCYGHRWMELSGDAVFR